MKQKLTTERMAEIAKLAIRLQQIRSCAAVTSSGETVLHHTHVDEILSALHDVTAELLANREAQPVAKLVYSSAMPRFIGDTNEIEGYRCWIHGETRLAPTMGQAYADANRRRRLTTFRKNTISTSTPALHGQQHGTPAAPQCWLNL
ncbi:hypothetical protein BVG97_16275 [Serratia marcescens]|uniref:hypothetical protein n=1 Tax=Serratia marcescens TaxID=615 RepID=UPI000B5F62D3|nr:hypothetical protein [Serratia marcescens]ASL89070.1 hypothetical protein BVG97_16275 [Serratia marcescens]